MRELYSFFPLKIKKRQPKIIVFEISAKLSSFCAPLGVMAVPDALINNKKKNNEVTSGKCRRIKNFKTTYVHFIALSQWLCFLCFPTKWVNFVDSLEKFWKTRPTSEVLISPAFRHRYCSWGHKKYKKTSLQPLLPLRHPMQFIDRRKNRF